MSALLPILQPRDDEPRLVGIARLASLGHSLDHGHEVEYFNLPARSLLNRCTSARMPFTWTINPYRGCEFACKYCYARYTHEFMEMRDGLDFETTPTLSPRCCASSSMMARVTSKRRSAGW